MRIAITGATGFIGTNLRVQLQRSGHSVIPISRQDLKLGAAYLSVHLQRCDAVINLAGEPINRRWSAAHKQAMVDSRVATTELLVEAMAAMSQPPETFISASAIGVFDSHGCYTESDQPTGIDFLARLGCDWERAAAAAEEQGVRTLRYRFALVLGREGGMIKQMLLPFRLGLGATVGDGQQTLSWIHIDDAVGAIICGLERTEMSGVYHISAPNPVSNVEFTRTMGEIMHRPTLLRLPLPLLRLVYGEGGEVIASGQHVTSARLPEHGFKFRYTTIDSALSSLLAPRACRRDASSIEGHPNQG